MKKIFLINFIFITTLGYTQNNKINLRSVDTGLGIYFLQDNSVNYGISEITELAVSVNSNIFYANISCGFAQIKYDPESPFHVYLDTELLYGREVKFSEKFQVEYCAGFAILGQGKVFDTGKIGIGIPAKVKVFYRISNYIDFGLSSGLIYNSVNSIYSTNLLIKFRR